MYIVYLKMEQPILSLLLSLLRSVLVTVCILLLMQEYGNDYKRLKIFSMSFSAQKCKE